MNSFYLGLIIVLLLLAIFDLVTGVSNDAVNFLNSAIGAKTASFRTIIIIAALGIFSGVIMSNGMMEIARHGIFRPENFYFSELICIFVSVMITDILLLDIFNTLGMPTSTTVSMVFELLGGTFALSMLKIMGDKTGTLSFGMLLNTDKALTVIFGIFISVAIAFFFGALVQYIARLIFSFNYKKNMKWSIGIFGGIAVTAIIYFMLIKGLKNASFITTTVNAWINTNTAILMAACFILSGILMQILYFLKINVLKIIVLLGTFALAMAFSGNDLVNFIGVPLAGYSSYVDYIANGQAAGPGGFLMGALNGEANTPTIFLLMAGIIMVITLMKSQKARSVVKTSLDLSRQEEGNEMFGSSAIARTLVRKSISFSNGITRLVPDKVKSVIEKRFNSNEAILENGASFDLIRASVNLVIASLLIALGTSLKLPLSTTYVTFMVAMGSSLSDKAWGRESAVFRITGVLSVIGGWFVTAGIAFISCFSITLILHYGGIFATLVMIGVAAAILLRSRKKYKAREEKERKEKNIDMMMASNDKEKIWELLCKHTRETLSRVLAFGRNNYTGITEAFLSENLHSLRKINNNLGRMKDNLKKTRKREVLILRKISVNVALEKNTWFHLVYNSAEQMIYSLKRMNEPCKEHIDNNFNPLPDEYAGEFQRVSKLLDVYMEKVRKAIENNDYEDYEQLFFASNHISEEFSNLRHTQLERIQKEDKKVLNVSIVYLNMIQESEELVSIVRHMLRASRKFQTN